MNKQQLFDLADAARRRGVQVVNDYDHAIGCEAKAIGALSVISVFTHKIAQNANKIKDVDDLKLFVYLGFDQALLDADRGTIKYGWSNTFANDYEDGASKAKEEMITLLRENKELDSILNHFVEAQ